MLSRRFETIRLHSGLPRISIRIRGGQRDPNRRSVAQDARASDSIFRRLVAEAVGGDRSAWETEYVGVNASGPDYERLGVITCIKGALLNYTNEKLILITDNMPK